jgi:hypothetical protein
MSAAEEVPPTRRPSQQNDTAIGAEDSLNARERERLADYVLEARRHAFPDELGAPENRIGESDQQDFYFRGLLDLLCANAAAHGVPAVAGTIDDLWRYTSERFERFPARRKRPFTRDTARQVAVHQWPRALERNSRTFTIDTRAFDHDDPTTPVSVHFSYTPPSEAAPFILAANVSGFALDSGTIVSISVTEVPRPLWLEAVEDAVIPTNVERQAEYADVLLAAVLRLLPPDASETARYVRQLRAKSSGHGRKSAQPQLDLDAITRLQSALAALRAGSSTDTRAAFQVLERLQIRDALRRGHDLIDALEEAAPEDRQTILASLALMVGSARPAARAAAVLVLVFLLVYSVPSPLQAAVHKAIQRFFDRIVVNTSLMGRAVSLDYERNLFVTPDGRATSEIQSAQSSWVKVAPSAAPGGRLFFMSLSEPDIKDWFQHTQFLTGFNTIGFNGLQYRERIDGSVTPWFVELNLLPRQDATLASEIVAREAVVTFDITPSPGTRQGVSSGTVEANGHEYTVFMEEFEFPHRAATYALRATLRRRSGATETYTGELTFNPDGSAVMTRPNIAPLEPVSKFLIELREGCTTIVPSRADLSIVQRNTTMLSAAAAVGDEQRVTFFVSRRGLGATTDAEYVLDFGDGSRAVRRRVSALETDRFTHRYREGNRAYTIKIYFDDYQSAWQMKALYVFSDRDVVPAQIYDYAAPYGPDPSLTRALRAATRQRPLSRILYRQRDGHLWPQ